MESSGSQAPWDIVKNIAQELLHSFGKTEMDEAVLFEHTILHELTHHKVVGKTQFSIGEKESYGWSECVTAKSSTNSGMAVFGDMYEWFDLT